MRQIRWQPRNPQHRSEVAQAEAARSAARQETKARRRVAAGSMTAEEFNARADLARDAMERGAASEACRACEIAKVS